MLIYFYFLSDLLCPQMQMIYSRWEKAIYQNIIDYPFKIDAHNSLRFHHRFIVFSFCEFIKTRWGGKWILGVEALFYGKGIISQAAESFLR